MQITPESLAKNNTEHGHQSAIFCYFALHQKQYPDAQWLFAVPNGGYRDKITANRLKAEGVKSGVPDIWLPVKRGKYSGLVIELKRLPKANHKRPNPSDEQKPWLDYLQTQGFGSTLCVGWIEARDTIIQYLNYME